MLAVCVNIYHISLPTANAQIYDLLYKIKLKKFNLPTLKLEKPVIESIIGFKLLSGLIYKN